MDDNGKPVDLLVVDNVVMLRDFLKHSKHFDVTVAMVKDVLFPEQTVVSAGVLNVSEAALAAEQERIQTEAPKSKSRSAVPKPDYKLLRRENKARVRGSYKQRSLHEEVALQATAAGKQDETTRVSFKLHDDSSIKQYGRINIEKNYWDVWM